MIYEINKTDSEKLPLKSLQPKSKARSLYPWLFQSLSKPQVYLVTPNMLIYAYLPFFVLSMALIQSEIVRPQVITAKCGELQADTIKVEVKEIRIIP